VTRDIVIIGGGHNGLVAAFHLARAGFKPLVLERRDDVGGGAITEEFHPGFRGPILAHAAGPLRRDVLHDLQLERHGLAVLRPGPSVFAPGPDGRGLVLHDDPAQSARELARFSPRDAERYAQYHRSVTAIGGFLAVLLHETPPPLDGAGPGDLWTLLKTGRRFRGLDRRDAFRLLRWMPMAVADLAAEWFDTEPARAVAAARGIFGAFAGPWSAGTGALFLYQAALEASGGGSYFRGGPGALTQAMAAAARQAGAEIRTGADVRQLLVRNGAATGVVLAEGEEIAAGAVVSNVDPPRTFLGLIDPVHLDPDFVQKIRNYRCTGSAAKVNLALADLPRFAALAALPDASPHEVLSSRIHIGPDIDYLERAFDAAKYGDFSREPYLDVRIPSLLDSSLAPEGRHVMSVYVQFAPYRLREGAWRERADALGDTVVQTLARHAPGLERLVLGRQVITPADLEETYGLTGGHIFHGEPSLDQLFTMRPLLGWARYRTPIRGLYLCGAGTHPGGGVTGGCGTNAAREIVRDLRKGKGSSA
jgi:phytoene dehydrogenase-like protein